MKIILNFLSGSICSGTITVEEFAIKFEKIIDTAFRLGIRIWHSGKWNAGKKIELTKDFFNGLVHPKRMAIKFGGSVSFIPAEKVTEFILFMYPGDTVSNGSIRSIVNSHANPFKLCHAVFGDDIDTETIQQFQDLGGIVDTSVTQNTLLVVSSSNESIVKFKSQCTAQEWERMQLIDVKLLKSFFPVKSEIKPSGEVKKRVCATSLLYPSEMYMASTASNRIQLSKVKKLLTDKSIDLVNSGLMMLEGLNDPILIDKLLEGIDLVNFELSPNTIFSGTKTTQPLLNYAMLGLLSLVDDSCLNSISLKNSLKELHIDVPDLNTLKNLQGIKRLVLSDSLGLLKTLDGLENMTRLNGLILKNCPNVKSISAIHDLPLQEFDFGLSCQIESFTPLKNKVDLTNRNQIEIIGFNNLINLDGIEFYQSLETVYLEECENLEEVSSLKKLPKLSQIKNHSYFGNRNHHSFPMLRSLEGILLPHLDEFNLLVKRWENLPNIEFSNCKFLSIQCEYMPDLDWLKQFPNLLGLSIKCKNLHDVSGIAVCHKLLALIIESPTVEKLSAIGKLQTLEALNINGCVKLKSIDFIENLTSLKFFGGSFNDIKFIPGILEYKNGDILLNAGKADSENTINIPSEIEGISKKLDVFNLLSIESWNPLFSVPFFKNYIIDLCFWDCNTENVSGISNLTRLKCLKITNGVANDHLIDELKQIIQFEDLALFSSKIISFTKQHTIHFPVTIAETQSIVVKSCKFKLLNLIDTRTVGIEKCEIDELRIERSYSLQNLEGLRHNLIKALKLDSLNNLIDANEISKITGLKFLSINRLNKLENIGFLAGMLQLDSLYTEECVMLAVKPKSKGVLISKNELLNYQLRIAKFYKLPVQREIASLKKKSKLKNPSGFTFKEYVSIKKLLLSRDLDKIMSGVDLLSGLDNETLCAALLEGIVYEKDSIWPNKIFTGTGPAQPYLNTALMGVLNVASKYPYWANFISAINNFNMDILVLDYLSCLKNATHISVSGASISTVKLALPELRRFQWHSKPTWCDLPVMNSPLNIQIFEDCQKLEYFNISLPLDIDGDFSCFLNFTNLKELYFGLIRKNQIASLKFLENCRMLEFLHIKFENLGNISSLDGLSKLSDIRNLSIINAAITDTSALRGLKNIQYLTVFSPRLENFTPCDDFSNLIKLDLSSSHYDYFTKKSVIIPLKNLGDSIYPENMHSIHLDSTSITQFPNFRNLKSVDNLTLSNTPISDFSGLGTIRKIKNLNLSDCEGIRDFQGFENVEEIDEMRLYSCSNLVSFRGLQGIRYKNRTLNLFGCVKLQSIEDLPKVEWSCITIASEKLPKVNKGLKCKDLELRNISSIEGIGAYDNKIEGLDLSERQSKSPLSDFSPLKDIPNLKRLTIQTDKVLSLKHVSHFNDLEVLNLVGCTNLTDPEKLQNAKINILYIALCNLKKSQFPESLQDNINWQSKPYGNFE